MVSALPSQLGRYKILDEIGRGAMGVVYLAKDPLIGRLLALKTFRISAALSGRSWTPSGPASSGRPRAPASSPTRTS